MLIGLLGTQLADKLKESGFTEDLEFYEAVKTEKDILTAFEAVKRLALDVLILDFTDRDLQCQMQEEIRRYRLLKPRVRIVLINNLTQPEEKGYIGQNVLLGIYDILQPAEKTDQLLEQLRAYIQRPSTLQDVWQWHPGQQSLDGSEQTVKVVYRDRFVGTIIIAIAGVDRGVGCTHLALCLSRFLATEKVALVELSPAPVLSALNPHFNSNAYKLEGIAIYPEESLQENPLSDIYQDGYNYVILDLGFLNPEAIPEAKLLELSRADFPIMLAGGATWQLLALRKWLRPALPSSGWQFFLNNTTPSTLQSFQAIFQDLGLKKCPKALPYNPDPFRLNEDQKEIFSELLQFTPASKKFFGIFPGRKMSWPMK